MLLRENLSASLVEYRIDAPDGVLRALNFDYRGMSDKFLDSDYWCIPR